jgi:hypothetical protein
MGSPPRSLKLSLLSVLLVELAWQLHPQWRHSFGAKSVSMLVKVQSTLLSGKKQSGSRVPENFGGVLMRRSESPLK